MHLFHKSIHSLLALTVYTTQSILEPIFKLEKCVIYPSIYGNLDASFSFIPITTGVFQVLNQNLQFQGLQGTFSVDHLV